MNVFPFCCVEKECGKKFKTKYSLKAHAAVHSNEKLFQCDECPKAFNRKTNLLAHKNTHVKDVERPYTCRTCGKGCSFKSELRVHERSHTGERPFKCSVCGQRFSQRGNLSQHEITHTDVRAQKCEYPGCFRAYKYLTDLQKHQKWKHGMEKPLAVNQEKLEDTNKEFECKDCGKKFRKGFGYKLHGCKAEPKPFACNKCNKSFSKIFQLQNHKRQHAKTYKCQECDVGFVTELLLHQHEMTHKRFACSTCAKVFTVEKDYKEHLKTHVVKKEGEEFVCSVCSKVFSGAPNLKMHEAKVHGLSPFRCKVCVEGFQRASQLKQHEEIHLKESPHCCGHCDQPFLTESDLSHHAKEHTGRFCCENCGENFKFKRDLTKHKCTDDKAMMCSLCEENFTSVAELESHMIEHVEKESFECAQCMKEFLDVPSLRTHEKNEHLKLDPYPCTFCELRFTNRSEHKIHSEIHNTMKCQHCNEFFPTAADRQAHESDHLVCEHCSAKFTTLDKVKLHVKSCKSQNTDKSKKAKSGFPCPVCERCFTQLGNMQTHKRKVHGIEPYQCQSCGEYFSLLSLLKRHLAMEHSQPIKAKKMTTNEQAPMPLKNSSEITKEGQTQKSSDPANKTPTSKTRAAPKKVETELQNKVQSGTKRKMDESEQSTPPRPKRGVARQGATPGGKGSSENHTEMVSKKLGGKIRLPFKCRHCELKFPSASKKMQHEQSH